MPTFRTSQPVSAADPSQPHVILVGLPGAGKTTVGGMLAEALKRSFLDFDAEIVRRQGMSVAEIFGQKGEGAFREMEHDLTREVQLMGNMVLAPGGGWIGRPENVALLRPPGILVYLKVSPATAVRRMGASSSSRPLLQRPDPKGEAERLLAARRAAYEAADLVVDTERLDLQQVTKKLVDMLGNRQ